MTIEGSPVENLTTPRHLSDKDVFNTPMYELDSLLEGVPADYEPEFLYLMDAVCELTDDIDNSEVKSVLFRIAESEAKQSPHMIPAMAQAAREALIRARSAPTSLGGIFPETDDPTLSRKVPDIAPEDPDYKRSAHEVYLIGYASRLQPRLTRLKQMAGLMPDLTPAEALEIVQKDLERLQAIAAAKAADQTRPITGVSQRVKQSKPLPARIRPYTTPETGVTKRIKQVSAQVAAQAVRASGAEITDMTNWVPRVVKVGTSNMHVNMRSTKRG